MSDDSIFSKWAPVVVYSLTPDRASWKANHDEAWGALQTTADKVIVHFEHTVKPIEVQLTGAHEWLAAGAKFCTLSDGADSNFGFYFEDSAQAAQCTAAVTRQLRSLRTGKMTSSQRAVRLFVPRCVTFSLRNRLEALRDRQALQMELL